MIPSIAAIAGPTPATPARGPAATGVFALSLAQVAGVAAAGKDGDPPPPGDPQSDDDADTRQDDAANGNALPPAVATPPDPSLLAGWLPPLPPALPAATPVASDRAATASATIAAANVSVGAAALVSIAPPAVADPVAPPPPSGVTDMAKPSDPASPSIAPVDPSVAPSVAPSITPTLSPIAAPMPASIAAPAIAAIPAMPLQPTTPRPSTPTLLPTTASAIAALTAPVSLTGVTIAAVQAPSTGATILPAPTLDPTPTIGALRIDTRAAPVVALSPAQGSAPLQPGAPVAATTTSAIQAFGSAMRAGLAKDAPGDPTDGPVALPAAVHAAATPAVAAAGDAQQAPLDLRRENWPHAMIDRIEALRDAADATSTRMRVVPDALGPIEMSVRKDGDTLHVHFAADQAQTRALLIDAQPRLAAIAEQRGLRLGGGSVDSGAAGSGQQQQQATARQPAAPASFTTTVTADAAADDHTRLA